jgi:FO synthase
VRSNRPCPTLHIHAFSPLEISQGAAALGASVADLLIELKAAGLGSLPGTAAEILDDEVRAIICPDKVTTAQWLDVIATAHRVGLRTTATIMFGHVDAPRHWARHCMPHPRLQARTGGFTEFVPLPFVPMEAPMQLRGADRFGPTFREAGADARGARAGAASADPQHPDLLGEDGTAGRGGLSCAPAPTTSAAR